jgi:hypothetical protein
MKKRVVVGIFSFMLMVFLVACEDLEQSSDTISTGGGNDVTAEQPAQNEKKLMPNLTETIKKVKVHIAEVRISPDYIKVGLNYEHTGTQQVSWYPDQGHMMVGDLQLQVDIMENHGLVVGEIAPGAKSDGVITYRPQGERKLDVEKITKIRLDLDEIMPEDLSGSKKVSFEIPIQ